VAMGYYLTDKKTKWRRIADFIKKYSNTKQNGWSMCKGLKNSESQKYFQI
jgi:hypothetical protein